MATENSRRSSSHTAVESNHGDSRTSLPRARSSSSSPSASSTTRKQGDKQEPGTALARNFSREHFILNGSMRFLRDLVTFLVRGGLSSLMFFMDQALHAILLITKVIPGGIYIAYSIRLVMWMFQLTMWIVYTSLELILYLPWTFLVVYLLMLALFYMFMPEAAHQLLHLIFWIAHSFLHWLKDIYYYNKN